MGDSMIQLVQRIIERQGRIAAKPEYVLDIVGLQGADKGFSAGWSVAWGVMPWGLMMRVAGFSLNPYRPRRGAARAAHGLERWL